MTELKPCPFCGNEGRLKKHSNSLGFYVVCGMVIGGKIQT